MYLARSAGGRQVALKVIRSEDVDEPHFRARFRREVAAARKVSGAFTVPVVDADADSRRRRRSAVAGHAVRRRGRAGRPGALTRPAAHGRCHAAGRAVDGGPARHPPAGPRPRDLEPANVLLADNGVRVIDFGIARSVTQSRALTRSGATVGTPAGASGWIALGADGAPEGKAIPVLRITRDGRTTAAAVTSAEGRPRAGGVGGGN
ncbi:hypothetical protein [Streptomyces sp. NPDC057740]|uniref:hypothetical protein n=1 Tax=Streptomyces sp. NPDC057740 TaxID=3346234 RepID=UPI003698AFE3